MSPTIREENFAAIVIAELWIETVPVPFVNVNVFEIIGVAEVPSGLAKPMLSALSPFLVMLFSTFRSRASAEQIPGVCLFTPSCSNAFCWCTELFDDDQKIRPLWPDAPPSGPKETVETV
jgi:hypothetical protein